ncbi:MAG: energy-coupling factor ABC transporter ATP-binding protein [Planctomycetaceae bacterium]|nr:energy-coupling factor ABC transporter ATP-binding protein [Planctomycetaceae bacterium]
MLKIENIEYAYPGGKPALRNASAELAGGITVIVGPNAGGKTTLLRVLAGLLEPGSGRIVDEDGTSLSPADLRQATRMVMQDADPQILGATVAEDVLLGKPASGLGGRFDLAATVLRRRLDLDSMWRQPVGMLSYGQKRKLCLLHAMLAGPRCLLLDEPFAGLDFPAARELRRLIRENREEGLHQVISTHELEPVFDIADRLVVVANGEIAAQGLPHELVGRLGEWSVRAPGKGWD